MARATKKGNGVEPQEERAATAAHAEGSNDVAGGAGATIFEIDFDPEGWMSERPRYWLDRGPSMSPSRLSALRRRLREAASEMGASRLDGKRRPRTTQEEWIRLSEQALGPLPRPPVARQSTAASEASPAAPDDSQTASKEDGRRAQPGAPKTTDDKA